MTMRGQGSAFPSKNGVRKNFIFRFGWVLLFMLCTFIGYFHVMKKKQEEIASLDKRLQEIEREKELVTLAKEDLLMRIQSHGDPAWVEMVLMKELGVVPEGKMKVHFTKKGKQ
ncbi:MAG: hypothetical protein WCP39_05205 [Chlamydiota bacterium]